jgi:hypothetical protein
MRSRELPLSAYDTDKVANAYLNWYDPVFQPLVHQPITLLEIGVHRGGSLLLWRDYFPNASIVGIDVALPEPLKSEPRIHLFQGSQTDTVFLSEVARQSAPGGFDVIIDDASHVGMLTKVTFWHLFEQHLKPSGLYVIEDWGTGYWDDWSDGRTERPARPQTLWTKLLQKLGADPPAPFPNHSHGMVGFIKELIDEQGATDRTRRTLAGTPERGSKFDQMIITPSIVFIRKAAAAQWPVSGSMRTSLS